MLYDPNWQNTTTKNPSLNGLFAWLKTQPASRTYDWAECDRCVVGQYLAATHPYACVVYSTLFKSAEQYYKICETRPHTFGAALERAHKVFT